MSIYKEIKSQCHNYLLFKSMIPHFRMVKIFLGLPLYQLGIKQKVPFPLIINFLVTNTCNLACKFCSYKNFKKAEHHKLSFYEISNFLERIKNRECAFFISGGEPFVRKDIMKIIKEIKQKKFKLGICTNGVLLNRNIISDLIKFKVEVIVLSLHGPENIHNEITASEKSFKLLIQNIKLLIKNRKRSSPKIILNCTISQKNIDYLENIVDIAKRLKVDALRFEHLSFLTLKEKKQQENLINKKLNHTDFLINDYFLQDIRNDMAGKIRRIMKKKFRFPVLFKPYLNLEELHSWYSPEFNLKRKCLFVYHSIFIKPDGIVVPCEFILDSLGNIKNQSLEDIINSPDSIKFRSKLRNALMPGCHRCCKL